MRKYFLSFILLTSLAFTSCSTTKQINNNAHFTKTDSNAIVYFKKDLNSIFCDGEIDITSSNQKMSGNFELTMIRDSAILLDVFGPFGINVARIYSSKDSIYIYNLWSRKYYSDYQKVNGFEFFTPFVTKFFSFIIAEPFYDKDSLRENQFSKDTVNFSKKINQSENYDFTYLLKQKNTLNLSYKYNNNLYKADFTKFGKFGKYELPIEIFVYDTESQNKMRFKVNNFKDLNKVTTINNTIKSNFQKVTTFKELY